MSLRETLSNVLSRDNVRSAVDTTSTTTGRSESQTNDFLDVANENDMKHKLGINKLDSVIENKILKDKTPEAKAGRRRALIRAAYGEFMCTLMFYTPIFCVIGNGYQSNWSDETTTLAAAFVSGFQAISISFAFSSISGAQFNSAISFALWLTGKLSNRRAILYIMVQLTASIMGMVIVACIFSGNLQGMYNAIAVTPENNTELGRVFFTEFITTFILTYTAFTVAFEDAENQKKESMSFKTISDSKGLTLYASNPQSKTGFAPFSIGFTIFSLNLVGGSSGGAFNPGRMLGPAIFSGSWDYLYLYWIGQFLGASLAGLLVNNLHRFGLDSAYIKEDTSAASALAQLERNRSNSRAVSKKLPSSSNNRSNTDSSSEDGHAEFVLSPIAGERNT